MQDTGRALASAVMLANLRSWRCHATVTRHRR